MLPNFGDQIPFCDPPYYQGWYTPYHNESHHRFRAAVREFVDKEIKPFCHEWDEARSVPASLRRKAFEAGLLPGVVGPPWPTKYAGSFLAGGLKPEEYDVFHEYILHDELSRSGCAGVQWAMAVGLSIGLPPVLRFASAELRERVAPACLRGEKVICLAVTEPGAGSDVANLQTEARLTADGSHYIVNGEKKWITNGVFADFFTVAVRTGGAGMGGLSFLLLERGMPGITTKQMDCTGVWGSGTTYITFEDVKVPASNLIGQEGKGFLYIMVNFNHERWAGVVQVTRYCRVLIEECIRYAHRRRTFGKRLIDHAVIRAKIGDMARMVEALEAQALYLTYQMKMMSPKEAAVKLGGAIALAKVQSTQIYERCAREACQTFGGAAFTRTGAGQVVERISRDQTVFKIGGGSEEILRDMAVRNAMKQSNL